MDVSDADYCLCKPCTGNKRLELCIFIWFCPVVSTGSSDIAMCYIQKMQPITFESYVYAYGNRYDHIVETFNFESIQAIYDSYYFFCYKYFIANIVLMDKKMGGFQVDLCRDRHSLAQRGTGHR